MRTRIFLISIVTLLFLCCENNSLAQNCPEYQQLIREGEQFVSEKNYEKALKKFNAAKLCDPMKAKEVDEKINGVFEAIEKEKENAVEMSELALQAKERAEKQAEINKSFHLISESRSLIPIEGLSLLNYVELMSKDEKVIKALNEGKKEIMTQSNLHKFKKKHQFELILGSSKSRYLITRSKENKLSCWDTFLGRVPFFLSNKDKIKDLEFSPDESWLILTFEDDYTLLVNTVSGLETDLLEREKYHKNFIFSPNSKWLIIVNSMDQSFKLLDLVDQKELEYFNSFQKEHGLKQIKFSKDGNWLVHKSINNQTTILETATGNQFSLLKNNKELENINFSFNGSLVRIEYIDHSIEILSTETGTVPVYLKNENNLEYAFFSDNGLWLAIITNEREYKVFNTAKGTELSFLKNINKIRGMDFSEDSKWLITESSVDGINIWELSSGRIPDFLSGSPHITSVDFSEDCFYLVTIDKNSLSTVWEAQSGEAIYSSEGLNSFWKVSCSTNHKIIALFKTSYSSIDLFDTESKRLLDIVDQNEKVYDAFISPNGQWFITRSYGSDGIWSLKSDAISYFIKDKSEINSIEFSSLGSYIIINNKLFDSVKGNESFFFKDKNQYDDIQISPKENWAITSKSNRKYKIWDIKFGRPIDFLDQFNEFTMFDFSANDRWLKTIHDSGPSYNIWEISKGSLASFPITEQANSNSKEFIQIPYMKGWSKFSDDANWLVETSINEQILIWQTSTGKSFDFLCNKKEIYLVLFVPNSSYILTKENSGRWEVWDILTGKSPDFLHDKNYIVDTSVSKDGRWLRTKDKVQGEMFWDLKMNQELHFHKNPNLTEFIGFSDDSRWIAINNGPEKIEVWELTTCKLVYTMGGKSKHRSAEFISESTWLMILEEENIIECFNLETSESSVIQGKYERNPQINNTNFRISPPYMCVRDKHRVEVYDINKERLVLKLWLNKSIEDIVIREERYLYISCGKALMKVDLLNQPGYLFSWGDGEPLEYNLEEINEWIETFGDEYLGPLSPELIEKYGLDVKN